VWGLDEKATIPILFAQVEFLFCGKTVQFVLLLLRSAWDKIAAKLATLLAQQTEKSTHGNILFPSQKKIIIIQKNKNKS